ncbi:MAG TPA: S8/S53 family peptidase, partial [Propionibacteriaceae bacterium]
MTQTATVARRPLVKYAPDELIVSLEHKTRVSDVLNHFEIPWSEVESSPLLDLALMQVSAGDEHVASLISYVQGSAAAAEWRKHSPLSTGAEPLDQVLWGLRGVFAEHYAGWSPSIGKNRFVGKVHGVGEVNHGGGGDPRAVEDGVPFAGRADSPGRGVRVGVLDTEIYPHPWITGGWVAPFDQTITGGEPAPYAQGHATFVTGLILSQAPGATVEVRGVLDEEGKADSWSVAKAIVDIGRTGLDILNLSFVCYTEDGQPPMVLAAAIDRLDPETVVVAAAGNHGEAAEAGDPYDEADARQAGWPAALDDVVAVGAVDKSGTPAPFTPDAPWVDMVALGVDVPSTYLPNAHEPGAANGDTFKDAYAAWSGTSFAAALVSGALAAETVPGHVPARTALQRLTKRVKPSAQVPVFASATASPLAARFSPAP